MAPAAGGHSDDRKAQRVRALLSNYYGTEGGDQAEPDSLADMQQQLHRGPRAPEMSSSHGATDLDSGDFNVDK